MSSLFQRCWRNRWIRGLAWTVISIVTLCLLFCAWLDWSGARSWKATLDSLAAAGETINFRQICSDPIPDEQNYCAIPLLKDLPLVSKEKDGELGKNSKRLEAAKLPPWGNNPSRRLGDAMLGKPIELDAWAALLRGSASVKSEAAGDAALDVLNALNKNNALIEELAEGLNRPRAQWTPAMKTRDLPEPILFVRSPQYQMIHDLSQMLALRSVAAAQKGDAAKSHVSALIVSRLTAANLDEPFLISELMAAAQVSILHRMTWEMCVEHLGTAEDFAKLESACADFDFRRAILRAFHGELASGVDMVQFWKRSRQDPSFLSTLEEDELSSGPASLERFVTWALPAGVFDAECASLVEENERTFGQSTHDPTWQSLLQSTSDCDARIVALKGRLWMHPSKILTVMTRPAMHTFTVHALYAQALVDQCVVACALERFRFEKGDYPETLDSVKRADGSPLPLDLVNGEPLHYRKTPNGRYALWSVGFDGKDDGGKRTLNEKHPEWTKFYDVKYVGDWVWDFPE